MVSVGVGISDGGIITGVGEGVFVGSGVDEGCGVGDSLGEGDGDIPQSLLGSVPLMKYSEYALVVATSVFNPFSLQIFSLIRLAGAIKDSLGVP